MFARKRCVMNVAAGCNVTLAVSCQAGFVLDDADNLGKIHKERQCVFFLCQTLSPPYRRSPTEEDSALVYRPDRHRRRDSFHPSPTLSRSLDGVYRASPDRGPS